LPNITGYQIVTESPNGKFLALAGEGNGSGALTYTSSAVTVTDIHSSDFTTGPAGISLDAKRASSLYVDNGRNRPNSLVLNYAVKC
jgi:hypothetical protein